MLLQVRKGVGSSKDYKLNIRLCAFNNVAKPKVETNSIGNNRVNEKNSVWKIPYNLCRSAASMTQSEDGIDICLHPEAIHLANSSALFKHGVGQLALATLENLCGLSSNMHQSIMADFGAACCKTSSDVIENDRNDKDSNGAIQPKYVVNFIGEFSKEFLHGKENVASSHQSSIRIALKIDIKLPLLNSGKDVDLNIFENKMILKSSSYKLQLNFLLNIDVAVCTSVYEKKKHTLVVFLPIINSWNNNYIIVEESCDFANTEKLNNCNTADAMVLNSEDSSSTKESLIVVDAVSKSSATIESTAVCSF